MQISVDKEAMTNLACMCVAVVSMWTNPACMCVDVVSMWITHKTLLMTGTFLKTPFIHIKNGFSKILINFFLGPLKIVWSIHS